MRSLKAKRVFITGAAHGLGKAMARRFAARGAELVLTDVNEELLEATREELAGQGATCCAYRLDVTDAEEIAAVREKLHADAGPVEVLVNNAGVVFAGPFLEVPLERHRATYRVNVEGMVTVTHAFLPDLVAAEEGHLVYTASASGFVGLPKGATYASSKWATIGLAESLRTELRLLGHRHVGVTSVCPTYINTGMFEGAAAPKTTKMLDADDIAGKVVRAVETRKVWVREPWIVKITPLLQAALPTPVRDFVADVFGVSRGLDHWRGHGNS